MRFTDDTIVRLMQLGVAAVAILAGASVAKAAINRVEGRAWQVAAGLVLSVVFVWAAITLATHRFGIGFALTG